MGTRIQRGRDLPPPTNVIFEDKKYVAKSNGRCWTLYPIDTSDNIVMFPNGKSIKYLSRWD